MNYLRLLAAFFWANVMSELAYRVNFVWQLFQSFLSLGISWGGLAVIFSYTETLGGWRPDEILALVGVYFLVGGLVGLVIQPGMEQFIESVRDGTLDFTLTKPEDAQLTTSIKRIEIWKLIDIALGVAVLVYWPLMKGLLAGRLRRDESFAGDSRRKYPMFQGDEYRKNLDLVEELRRIAALSGHTVAQLVVNWTIHRPGITAALCGAKRPEQLRETAAAAGWTLTGEQLAEIDEALARRGTPATRVPV